MWEAQGQDPAYGDKFTFTPTNSGLEWVEVEAELPRWPASVRFRKYHGPLVHGPRTGQKRFAGPPSLENRQAVDWRVA